MIKKTLILLFILLYLTPKAVDAASYSLSVNPPLLRVSIKPGKSITQVFTITNQSREDKILVARIVPFTASDTKGNPDVNIKDTASWINYFSLSNSNIKLNEPFSIRSGSSEQLVVNLKIPQSAQLKDLYATLLISTYQNNLGLNQLGSQISASIGANLLITVHNELFPPTLLKISKLSPSKGLFFTLGNYIIADNITPLTFNVTLKNSGNYLTESKGVFKVSTRKDEPVFLQGILPLYITAGSERDLVDNTGHPFAFQPEITQIGAYRVTAQIVTDNGNTISNITVILLPFKASLALTIAIVIMMIINSVFKAKKSANMIDTN